MSRNLSNSKIRLLKQGPDLGYNVHSIPNIINGQKVRSALSNYKPFVDEEIINE